MRYFGINILDCNKSTWGYLTVDHNAANFCFVNVDIADDLVEARICRLAVHCHPSEFGYPVAVALQSLALSKYRLQGGAAVTHTWRYDRSVSSENKCDACRVGQALSLFEKLTWLGFGKPKERTRYVRKQMQ
jgi:hypothetical protein